MVRSFLEMEDGPGCGSEFPAHRRIPMVPAQPPGAHSSEVVCDSIGYRSPNSLIEHISQERRRRVSDPILPGTRSANIIIAAVIRAVFVVDKPPGAVARAVVFLAPQ